MFDVNNVLFNRSEGWIPWNSATDPMPSPGDIIDIAKAKPIGRYLVKEKAEHWLPDGQEPFFEILCWRHHRPTPNPLGAVAEIQQLCREIAERAARVADLMTAHDLKPAVDVTDLRNLYDRETSTFLMEMPDGTYFFDDRMAG
jgi:hypothetical protein